MTFLNKAEVVAAVHKVERVHIARIIVGCVRGHKKARIVPV